MKVKWTKNMVVEGIQRRHDLGKSLRYRDVYKDDPKLVDAARRFFSNSWGKAVVSSGYEYEFREKPIPNKITETDTSKIITVTQLNGETYEVIVDKGFIIDSQVNMGGNGYAKYKKKQLHNHILPSKKGFHVDHIDGNKLNNKSSNLRYLTYSQNQQNQRAPKGYFWHKQMRKWNAGIVINRKRISLGLYDCENEARLCYLLAKMKYHDIQFDGMESEINNLINLVPSEKVKSIEKYLNTR